MNEIESIVGVMAGPSRLKQEWDREVRKGYAVVEVFLAVGLVAWLIV